MKRKEETILSQRNYVGRGQQAPRKKEERRERSKEKLGEGKKSKFTKEREESKSEEKGFDGNCIQKKGLTYTLPQNTVDRP